MKIWPVLIVSAVLNSTALIAQKSIPLIGYQNHALWLTENQGKYGLKNDVNTVLVPAHYDLVLPALQKEFSFIVEQGKLGVFDHLSQKEVLLQGECDEIQLYPGKNGEFYLYYIEKKAYYTENKQIYVLKRDNSGEIVAAPADQVTLAVSTDGFYQNGVERIDDSHFVHHCSRISWDSDKGLEEEPGYAFQDTLQLSGIFSLTEKDFIVPPSYAYVEMPQPGDIENPLRADFIQVTTIAPDSISRSLKNPVDAYRYGLYDTDYNTVIAPQPQQLWYVANGGFYIKKRSNEKQALSIYDKKGKVIFHTPDFTHAINGVVSFKDRIYVGAYGEYEAEIEMNVSKYYIYRLTGELLKTDKFYINEFLNKNGLAKVSVTQSSTSYDMFYGIYDLENSKYVIPPEFLNINSYSFKDEAYACPPEITCDYYYACYSGDKYIYFDSAFKQFEK